ncbi:MAG: T9SS type A sorting domain-containing protein [bacterium]|nr:T9SS type A sorting domain-containing protein [bacterium]
MGRYSYIIVFILLATAANLGAAELPYPSTAAINSTYEVSNLQPRLGDTVQIIRTFVNHELFDLTGVYLSDNLPESFQVLSSQVTVNGNPVPPGFETDGVGSLTAGYIPYRWVTDDPAGGSPNTMLSPGDSLELVVDLVCHEAGQFSLQDHASVAYGNSSGLFASPDDAVILNVSISTAVEDEKELPDNYLISNAYPNPFNSRTTIAYSRRNSGILSLEIYDLLGRLVYDSSIPNAGADGLLSWDADNVGSGLYLYRLRSGSRTSGGKLMLLK